MGQGFGIWGAGSAAVCGPWHLVVLCGREAPDPRSLEGWGSVSCKVGQGQNSRRGWSWGRVLGTLRSCVAPVP